MQDTAVRCGRKELRIEDGEVDDRGLGTDLVPEGFPRGPEVGLQLEERVDGNQERVAVEARVEQGDVGNERR